VTDENQTDQTASEVPSETAPATSSEVTSEQAPESPEAVSAPEAAATPEASAPEPAPTPEAPATEAPASVEASEVAPGAPEAAQAAGEPQVIDPTSIAEGDVEYIEEDDTPRQKPAIPGADLIPDIVSEGSDFLDAEARAAAEAEAEEAAAAQAAGDQDETAVTPIADATIDLGAGARYAATGKRKTGVARVILRPGTGTYLINGKALEEFFPRETLQRVIRQPLEAVGYDNRMDVVARMHGGGVSAQAGALRHGISRALLEADPNLRGELKRRGFLTRDPRVKERKKAGLKKARKRPQFSKR
jgi:small subunit ribosomal protein S9